MKPLFARFGQPDTIVTDNGTPFVSQEFQTFLIHNGIRHITSAPYHPATNGLAERAVQIVKQGLKKVTTGSWVDRLTIILFNYRSTPQGTTGETPAKLLMNRQLKSRLSLLKPNYEELMDSKCVKQECANKGRRNKRFEISEKVYARNFRPSGSNWLPGTIVQTSGPVSYVVRLENGCYIRRHLDHLKKRELGIPYQSVTPDVSNETFPEAVTLAEGTDNSTTPDTQLELGTRNTVPVDPPPLRRSTRDHRPPDRFAPSIK